MGFMFQSLGKYVSTYMPSTIKEGKDKKSTTQTKTTIPMHWNNLKFFNSYSGKVLYKNCPRAPILKHHPIVNFSQSAINNCGKNYKNENDISFDVRASKRCKLN